MTQYGMLIGLKRGLGTWDWGKKILQINWRNGKGGIRTPEGSSPYTTSNRAPSTTRTPFQYRTEKLYNKMEKDVNR